MLPANQRAFMALANAFRSDTRVNGIAHTNVCDLEEDTSQLHSLFTMRVLMSTPMPSCRTPSGNFLLAGRAAGAPCTSGARVRWERRSFGLPVRGGETGLGQEAVRDIW